MVRKILALTLIINIFIFSIFGCWSRKEIETLAFVTLIGIDKEGDDTVITQHIALPEVIGGEGGPGGTDAPVWTVTGRGRTIGEANRNVTRFVGKEIYLPHVRAVIVGEELAKENLAEVIDFFSRHWQLRGTHWFMIAKGKASEIMMVEPKITAMPAFYIDEMFRNIDYTSLTPRVNFLEFQRRITSTAGEQAYAPVIHRFYAQEGRKREFIEEENQEEEQGQEGSGSPGSGSNEVAGESLSLEQIAVFKNHQLIGWLNEEESMGFMWILGEVTQNAIVLENSSLGEGVITKLTTFARSNIVVKPSGDTVKIDIFIEQEGNLLEHNLGIEIADPENINVLNREVAALIKKQAEACLFKLQKQLQSDILGIAEKTRQQQAEIWAQMDWEEEFPDLEINVHVNSNTRRIGRITWPAHRKKPWSVDQPYVELPYDRNIMGR